MWRPQTDPWGLRKTDEAKAFRRKLLRRPIALRGDTEHFQPKCEARLFLRYLEGMDEPLINGIKTILRETMGGTCLASAEGIATLRTLCQEVGCPYHDELCITTCCIALAVLWMVLHKDFFNCVAERAVKPCRSARSKTRGGMIKSHDTCKTGSKHQHPNKQKHEPNANKQKPTGGKCQWKVRRVVKRGETPEALMC